MPTNIDVIFWVIFFILRIRKITSENRVLADSVKYMYNTKYKIVMFPELSQPLKLYIKAVRLLKPTVT